MSGRNKEFVNKVMSFKNRVKTCQKEVYYLDKDGFTGVYREGNFYFQKFHSEQAREDLLKRLGDGKVFIHHDRKSSFQLMATKTRDLPVEDALAALRFEFNLPLPKGFRYGLQDEIESAYRKAICSD